MPNPPRIALLVETSNRYARDLLHGVQDWMRAHERWTTRLVDLRDRRSGEWLRHWEGEGIIARVDTPELAAALRRTGLPVVDVGAERAKSEFPHVTIDNRAVAELAAEHFRQKQVRALAFYGETGHGWVEERGEAFASLVRRRGSDVQTLLLNVGRADADRRRAAWLERLAKPVGIFAANDEQAHRLIEACHALQLNVPRDVAVLGVDDDEVICELCDPPLSSVLPNARRTGYEAAEALAGMLRTRRSTRPAARRLVPPIRVVARQSSDLSGVGDGHVATAVRVIQARAAENLTVKDLLGAVAVSRTVLERKFRRATGESPYRHITRERVERIRALLIETDYPIARIADLTGFSSPAYLSAYFRRETGRTPREFRRESRTPRS